MSEIESLMHEHRVFPPSDEIVKNAAISGMDAYLALCREADQDYEGFWRRLANEHLNW
jgi:acetyl-CoA synthetase